MLKAAIGILFLDAVGLENLATGVSRTGDGSPYAKIQVIPLSLAKYNSVRPPVKLTDEDGNETGEERFNYWREVAR